MRSAKVQLVRVVQWFLVVAVVALALLAGCRPGEAQQQPQQPPQVQVLTVPSPPSTPAPPAPPAPPSAQATALSNAAMGDAVLRVYNVPKGYGEMLAEELQRLLIVVDKPVGKVRQMPGDQLMVLAPASVHSGVESLLASLEKMPPAPNPHNQDVESQYWFVVATPGNAADGEGLSAIKDTLAQIEAKQGPMSFKLLDQMTVRSSDGRESRIQSKHARITQRLFPASNQQTLGALVILMHDRQLLETEIHVKAGQTLVLGQILYEDPFAPKNPPIAVDVNTDGGELPAPAKAGDVLLVVARFGQQTP